MVCVLTTRLPHTVSVGEMIPTHSAIFEITPTDPKGDIYNYRSSADIFVTNWPWRWLPEWKITCLQLLWCEEKEKYREETKDKFKYVRREGGAVERKRYTLPVTTPAERKKMNEMRHGGGGGWHKHTHTENPQWECCLCGPRFTLPSLGSDFTCSPPAARHNRAAQPSNGPHWDKATSETLREFCLMSEFCISRRKPTGEKKRLRNNVFISIQLLHQSPSGWSMCWLLVGEWWLNQGLTLETKWFSANLLTNHERR